MSDATTAPTGTAAPDAADTTTAQPSAKAPDPQKSEPGWLPERLEQAKRAERAAILKELGVADPSEAKAAIAKAKELEEARKSDLEKLTDKIRGLEPAAAKAKELDALVSSFADAELAKLTEEQKAAVLVIAGDDKAKALSTITALRPTWQKAAVAAPAAAPPPPPANTAPHAPPPAGEMAPTVNHKATWEAMRAKDPVAAAHYLATYAAEIFPPQ